MRFKTALVAAALAIAPVALEAQGNGYGAQKDIVTTAVEAGSFNTLAQALQAAGLVETLKG